MAGCSVKFLNLRFIAKLSLDGGALAWGFWSRLANQRLSLVLQIQISYWQFRTAARSRCPRDKGTWSASRPVFFLNWSPLARTAKGLKDDGQSGRGREVLPRITIQIQIHGTKPAHRPGQRGSKPQAKAPPSRDTFAMKVHRPTEQILLGNQVHLYQGFLNSFWGKFCLFVLYQGGSGPRPITKPQK